MIPPDDALITLKDACEIFFNGKISIATLKAEHNRGNLALSKIGRAYFTTIAKLREMESKCRVVAPARASGSIRREEHGRSSMDEGGAARASLLMKLERRKSSSANTSRQNTRSRIARRLSSLTS